MALALERTGRFEDALLALRNYQTYGDFAAAEIQKTQELIAIIEKGIERG